MDPIVVVTTLLDANRYPKQAIADAFRARWHAELDLRSIKESLEMAPLRCKSPQMVHRELWTHWLAYNLIRKVMAQAAIAGDRGPVRSERRALQRQGDGRAGAAAADVGSLRRG